MMVKEMQTASQEIIDENSIVFTNDYEATGSTQLSLHKILNGGTLKGNDLHLKLNKQIKMVRL